MSAKYTYKVEVQTDGKWVYILDGSKDFCMGYLTRTVEYSPRLAMRVIRSDGKVIDSIEKSDEVQIGMVASWPTPEQYEAAARRALAAAEEIRKFKSRR
jgi:hypothetical protein